MTSATKPDFAAYKTDRPEDPCGQCPECGRNDGYFEGPGTMRTFFCRAHRIMWSVQTDGTGAAWPNEEFSSLVRSMRPARGGSGDWLLYAEGDFVSACGFDWRRPALFDVGRVLMTRGASALDQGDVLTALARHQRGDWGNVCEQDWQENDISVKHRMRLLSSFTTRDGTPFWVITEADRSTTTVLLPDEY